MARTSVAYLQRYLSNAVQLFFVGAGWPRCDMAYDAARGLYLPGVRLEPERQNVALQSGTMDQTTPWGWANLTTVSVNGSIGPTGVAAMDGTIGNLTNTYHGLAHANIACSGAAYTFSIFAKQGNKVGVQLDFDGASTVTFNLATGAVITNSFPATVEARIVKCGGDICRASVRKTVTAGNKNPSVYACDASGNTTFVGDTVTVNTWYWGAQLEIGAYPSSPIDTVAAAATRTTDAPIVHSLVGDYTSFALCLPFMMPRHTPAADTLIYRLFKNGSEADDHVSLWYSQTTGQFKVTSAATGGAAGLVTVPINICDDGVHWLHVSGRNGMLCAWVDWASGGCDDTFTPPNVDRSEYSVSGGWAGAYKLLPQFSRIPIRPEQPGVYTVV